MENKIKHIVTHTSPPKSIINKIIAVEGVDKVGKSTFCNIFKNKFEQLNTNNSITNYHFPNSNSIIGTTITKLLMEAPSKLNSSIFLSEMNQFWSDEIWANQNSIHNNTSIIKPISTTKNYIFDRYLASTLAYNAFVNNNKNELNFIKTAILNNKFLKLPTDIIFLDCPTNIIIDRTNIDQKNDLNDLNDTIDPNLINQRREALINSIKYLKSAGTTIHIIDNAHSQNYEDLANILIGKIF